MSNLDRPQTDAEAANSARPDTSAPQRWDDPAYEAYVMATDPVGYWSDRAAEAHAAGNKYGARECIEQAAEAARDIRQQAIEQGRWTEEDEDEYNEAGWDDPSEDEDE